MDPYGSSEQPRNPVSDDDNEPQSINFDDGHPGSQYSHTSFLGDCNGSYKNYFPACDAGEYEAHRYPGSPSYRQPDPVGSLHPQQLYHGDFLLDLIRCHVSQSDAGHVISSLSGQSMEQEEGEYSWMLPPWSQSKQTASLNIPSETAPPMTPCYDYGHFVYPGVGNHQPQAITPHPPEGRAALGSIPESQQTDQHHSNGGAARSGDAMIADIWCDNFFVAPRDPRDEPWSSVSRNDQHGQILEQRVHTWGGMADPDEARRMSYGRVDLLNAGDDRGQASTSTLRPDNNSASDQVHHQGFPSTAFVQTRQSSMQRPIGFEYPSLRQEGQTGSIGTADATPRLRRYCPSVHPENSSRSRRSSVASAASSDSFQCPSCPARFRGVHGKGNWGRHNRQKHKGEIETFPCEMGCNKFFQRKDALKKHYQSRSHRS